MLPEWGGFIWSCSDCFGSYGSWNYVIKDMGGRIDDALGVSGRFYYQWRFWYPFSIGTLLVKITDENAKEAQVQKR
jgi:hypothetical protein